MAPTSAFCASFRIAFAWRKTGLKRRQELIVMSRRCPSARERRFYAEACSRAETAAYKVAANAPEHPRRRCRPCGPNHCNPQVNPRPKRLARRAQCFVVMPPSTASPRNDRGGGGGHDTSAVPNHCGARVRAAPASFRGDSHGHGHGHGHVWTPFLLPVLPSAYCMRCLQPRHSQPGRCRHVRLGTMPHSWHQVSIHLLSRLVLIESKRNLPAIVRLDRRDQKRAGHRETTQKVYGRQLVELVVGPDKTG